MTNRQTIRCAFGAIFAVFALVFAAGFVAGRLVP